CRRSTCRTSTPASISERIPLTDKNPLAPAEGSSFVYITHVASDLDNPRTFNSQISGVITGFVTTHSRPEPSMEDVSQSMAAVMIIGNALPVLFYTHNRGG